MSLNPGKFRRIHVPKKTMYVDPRFYRMTLAIKATQRKDVPVDIIEIHTVETIGDRGFTIKGSRESLRMFDVAYEMILRTYLEIQKGYSYDEIQAQLPGNLANKLSAEKEVVSPATVDKGNHPE